MGRFVFFVKIVLIIIMISFNHGHISQTILFYVLHKKILFLKRFDSQNQNCLSRNLAFNLI